MNRLHMNNPNSTRGAMTRRECLRRVSAGGMALALPGGLASLADASVGPKSIAAILTVYRPGLHADVLVGKILEGWEQDGGAGPNLKVASMYLDQSKPDDLGFVLAKKYNIPIFTTIEDALTLGTRQLAVDGVLSVGEHGDYPWNKKGQHLYPRRRFFEHILATFKKTGMVVPVFNDKHFGPVWSDAEWMYNAARALNVPLMAGSSIPVSFRRRAPTIAMNSKIQEIAAVGYHELDTYGFHTLEILQTFAERRAGAETGVRWVQCLQGEQITQAIANGRVSESLLDAAVATLPKRRDAEDKRWQTLTGDNVALFLFEYNDGLRGSVLMLGRHVRRGFAVAVQPTGHQNPMATQIEERREPYYPHFAYLMKAIERMFHTGQPTYPAERTLLVTGILDRILTSRLEGYRRVETPELTINYRPVDYPYAPNPPLNELS